MNFNCKSCGAELNDSMARCPYCGTLIPGGAEKEYMSRLEDIREDMAELETLPRESVRKELRSQGRRLRRVIAAAVIIALALAAAFFVMDKRYERDNTADYIWGRENFPVMDELFEKGEYEKLEEMLSEAMEEDRPVWDWVYFDAFMEVMEDRDEM